MRKAHLGLVLAGFAVLTAAMATSDVAARSQDPEVAALLNAGNEYLISYVQRASGVSMDETYTMTEITGGRMSVPLRLSSEIVFVNVNGVLHPMRDLTAVSGAKVKDGGGRIVPLLTNPTQAAWDQAQQYSHNIFQYYPELLAQLNNPLLALHLIQPAYHDKFTYKVDGKKKMNNVAVIGLRFDETRGELTKYIMKTRGNGYLTGRLWMDPATGAVHQTEVWLESRVETGRSNVTYAFHEPLNLWLPSKTSENYEQRPLPEGMINRGEGGYVARQTFEVNATYAKPRHTPIDLSKMR